MKPSEMVKTFTDRFPFVGPALWIVSFQYYVVQIIAAAAWKIPYSIINNTISDLGNTVCGDYSGRFVCSPLHGLMNGSFIMLGITMMIGAMLIYQEFSESLSSAFGFAFMALAGLGTILVGVFPENSIGIAHQLGAFLPFFVGNLGLVILGLVLDVPNSLRLFTFLAGVISLAAFGLFSLHFYLGLGIGGMERIVAYPQTVWLIAFGVYISSNHLKELAKN